jgi:hypothetical protein
VTAKFAFFCAWLRFMAQKSLWRGMVCGAAWFCRIACNKFFLTKGVFLIAYLFK